MTKIQWSPDTCDCTVEQDPSWIWVGTVKKCKLHKHLNGQALMNAIRAHRIPFNDKEVNQIPKEFLEEAGNADVSVSGWAFQKGRQDILDIIKKRDDASQARADEKERIRGLP